MEFNQFINDLQQELLLPLPGEESQYKMAPFERPLKEQAMKHNPSPRLSAVLCLFYPSNSQPHFTLILRNTYKGTHSAQVSFPGGKKEEEDENIMHTALRETEEEIGVPVKDINVIGELSEIYIPPSGYLVSPYIGFVEEKPTFIPDKIEVNSIIEIPLQLFMNEGIVKQKSIALKARKINVLAPYFDINEHVVWGATAMMLSELKEIIARFYK